MSTYMVEMNRIYGWDDAGWQQDDKPWRFATRAEAQAEIDELCAITTFDEPYNPKDFRVGEVTPQERRVMCYADMTEITTDKVTS